LTPRRAPRFALRTSVGFSSFGFIDELGVRIF
jgi:hypothetical protein